MLAGGWSARQEKVPQQALVRDITVCVLSLSLSVCLFCSINRKDQKEERPEAVSTLGGSHDIRVADIQQVQPTDRVTEVFASTTHCLTRVTEA